MVKTHLNYIMQFDYIRMINLLQDKNLRHETLLQLLVKPISVDLFDGNLSAMNSVPSMPNDRERTRPDSLPDYVISQQT